MNSRFARFLVLHAAYVVCHLRGDDTVVSMARLREGASVMTITTLGQGRRTDPEEYRLQARGGYGKINYKQIDTKGEVAGVRVVDENEDLILIADDASLFVFVSAM